MFWIVSAVVVLVLTGVAWWTSGRAKPGGVRPDVRYTSEQEDHIARSAFGPGSGALP